MSERPTLDEIAAFLADLKADLAQDDDPALAGRKADLLERIAETMPGDAEAADAARKARSAVDGADGQ